MTTPDPADQVRTAVAWIQAHYADPVDPADIAAAAWVSRRTLYRMFATALGITPTRYLRQVRLSAAREALLAGNPGTTTVTDVAVRCGFAGGNRLAEWYRAVYRERPVDTLRTST